MTRGLSIFIPLLLFSISLCAMLSPAEQEEIPLEEYEVYWTLMAKMAPASQYTVVNRTLNLQIDKDLADSFMKVAESNLNKKIVLSDDLIKDFNKKNKKSYSIKDKFTLRMEVFLISSEEISCLTGHPKYPYVQLSRVGFDKSKTYSLIIYWYQWGDRAGKDYLILMKKENDEWKIQYAMLTGVS